MKIKKNIIIAVVVINLIIFCLVNLLFKLRYETVDDFIIYNLYSGLDGTFNPHGIYISSFLCFILGIFFRLVPSINWHSIFLLTMQFLCFTLIGYRLIKKFQNFWSVIMYAVFTSVCYTTLLLSIQYTSVAALLLMTALFLLIDEIETSENYSKKQTIIIFSLFVLGIMLRIQSLLIIVPFMVIYFFVTFIKGMRKTACRKKIFLLIKYYLSFLFLTLIIYVSNTVIYNSNKTYKKYTEYNEIRTYLHDLSHVSYTENKSVFDEINWSENDWFLFYTFGNGDEKIYSKENLKKILDYNVQNNDIIDFNYRIKNILRIYFFYSFSAFPEILYFFLITFIISSFSNRKKIRQNILIFITTILIHFIFIALGRTVFRVIVPEYVCGILLFLYNMEFKNMRSIKNPVIGAFTILSIIFLSVSFSGVRYDQNDKSNYKNIRSIINYTNSHKENVYLYTVPSLQNRGQAYSVYRMPPQASFSNLRAIGGWDMYTQNYYDFKERYNLDGTLLDLLKENVYLIDGRVFWGLQLYENYKQNIIQSIEENYNVIVDCKKIKCFENLCIYKLQEQKL